METAEKLAQTVILRLGDVILGKDNRSFERGDHCICLNLLENSEEDIVSVGVGCVEVVVDQGLGKQNKQEIGLAKMLEHTSRIDSIVKM